MKADMPGGWVVSGWMLLDECEDLTLSSALTLSFRVHRETGDPSRGQVAVLVPTALHSSYASFRRALRVYSTPSALERAVRLAPRYGWAGLGVLALGGRGAVEAALDALTPEP